MTTLSSLVVVLALSASATSQESKPTKPSKPAARHQPTGIYRVGPEITVGFGSKSLPAGFSASSTAAPSRHPTTEGEALDAKLRHISHLASQAAHTTDLDEIEKKLAEMERSVVEAREKLWAARDAAEPKATGSPAADKATTDKPATSKPATSKPATSKPATRKPATRK